MNIANAPPISHQLTGTSHDVVDQREPGHPLQAGQRRQWHGEENLRRLGGQRSRSDRSRRDGDGRGVALVDIVEETRQGSEPGMVVELGDRQPGIASAQSDHQLRGGQRTATESEEVRLGTVDRRTEDVPPQPRKPAHSAAEFGAAMILVTGGGPR